MKKIFLRQIYPNSYKGIIRWVTVFGSGFVFVILVVSALYALGVLR